VNAKGQRRRGIDGPTHVMFPKSSPKEHQEESRMLEGKASVSEETIV